MRFASKVAIEVVIVKADNTVRAVGGLGLQVFWFGLLGSGSCMISRSRCMSSVRKGLPTKGLGCAGFGATLGDVANSADGGWRSTPQGFWV